MTFDMDGCVDRNEFLFQGRYELFSSENEMFCHFENKALFCLKGKKVDITTRQQEKASKNLSLVLLATACNCRKFHFMIKSF
jgi:hypothetical protein